MSVWGQKGWNSGVPIGVSFFSFSMLAHATYLPYILHSLLALKDI